MNEDISKYLIEEHTGKQWYFYLSESRRLIYCSRNGGDWTKPLTLDRHLVKCFSATIDNKDKVYLLVYTHTKQVIYYEWDGFKWQSRLIYRVQSRFEGISFVRMLTSVSMVHIFFYIENSLRKTHESLVHYYLDKEDWRSGPALGFSSDDGVIPQDIASCPKGNIYFIYSRCQHKESNCYKVIFHPSTMKWSTTALLFHTLNEIGSINIIVDKNNTIHLAWAEKNENNYMLKYKYKNDKDDDKQLWERELTLCEPLDKPRQPVILIGDKPLCFWMNEGTLQYTHPGEQVITEEPTEKVPKGKLYNYIYVCLNDNGLPPNIQLIGDGYPAFQWSILDMFKKENCTIKQPDKTSLQDTKQLEQENSPLKGQITGLASQIDEIYTSLYAIQDHLGKHDKTLHHLSTIAKKLTFEIEQNNITMNQRNNINTHHKRIGEISKPERDISCEVKIDAMEKPQKKENKEEKEVMSPELIDNVKSEEITLGNVSIIVNPENDLDEEN